MRILVTRSGPPCHRSPSLHARQTVDQSNLVFTHPPRAEDAASRNHHALNTNNEHTHPVLEYSDAM